MMRSCRRTGPWPLSATRQAGPWRPRSVYASTDNVDQSSKIGSRIAVDLSACGERHRFMVGPLPRRAGTSVTGTSCSRQSQLVQLDRGSARSTITTRTRFNSIWSNGAAGLVVRRASNSLVTLRRTPARVRTLEGHGTLLCRRIDGSTGCLKSDPKLASPTRTSPAVAGFCATG